MNTHTTETMAAFNRTTQSSQVMLEYICVGIGFQHFCLHHLCGYICTCVCVCVCVCVKPWLCSLYTYVLLHISMMQECMLAACDISLTRYLPITIV